MAQSGAFGNLPDDYGEVKDQRVPYMMTSWLLATEKAEQKQKEKDKALQVSGPEVMYTHSP